jgi:predicted phage gp36 major capsid-like protein
MPAVGRRKNMHEEYRQFTCEMRDENRQFQRDLILRFERSMRALSAEIRAEVTAHREESRRYFEALDAKAAEQRRATDELIEENRAQRQALLHILDRLGGGGTAPAT